METKRNIPAIEALIETTPNHEGLALTFSHGQTLRINLRNLSDAIATQATLHGLKQKLVDAAAISRNPETGRAASIEDKFAAVKEVYDRLLSGQWNKTREGGAGSGGLLFKALCRLYSTKTPDAIRDYLAGKSDAEKTALRANPKVAAIIAEIRAEEGKASNIDTDGLLNELEGE